MTTKIMKLFNQVTRRGSGASLKLFRYAGMVLVLLILGITNVWAGGSTDPVDDPEYCSAGGYCSAKSGNTAAGLVYMSMDKNKNPQITEYFAYAPIGKKDGVNNTKVMEAVRCAIEISNCAGVLGGNGPHATYYWAKPMRGWKFSTWENYRKTCCVNNTPTINEDDSQYPTKSTWNGDCDLIYGSTGRRQSTYLRVTAQFVELTPISTTYKKPVGGSYTVSYSYLAPKTVSRTYEWTDQDVPHSVTYDDVGFDQKNVSFSKTSSDEGDKTDNFYEGEEVTLTTTAANFDGWYANGTLLDSKKAKTYKYTIPASGPITVRALYKSATIGKAEGDLSPSVTALGSDDYTITIPITAYGSWTTGDFTVTFTPSSGSPVSKGTVSYSTTSGDVFSSTGTLTIPYTYNPSEWGNTDVAVEVKPKDGSAYGNTINFTIKASANEPVVDEAQIWENNVNTFNGTLSQMVETANALTTNPTIKLMQDKSIDTPLSLKKSMKFDLNDKTVTSSAASAFSIDAANIDVQIVDEGHGGNGTIATSASGSNVNVVTFTQKAKLTMEGGTLSVTNTGSGSAYGVDVQNGSTFYMTGGNLTVTGKSEARGVNVATASDYATLNGGTITVTAPTNAYGLWSAGQSNVTDVNLTVSTSTGANAYGVYVNGGDATLTTTIVTATAATTTSFGAYVNAGRMNFNGGSLSATGATTGVCGVYIASEATAMLQQSASVTAEATDANGANVFGVNNLGTLKLTNVTVTATSPTTGATAVNTNTGAVSTTIEDVACAAFAETGTAYGINHQSGSLNVEGGTYRGIINTSGSGAYGIRAAADATIANATLLGDARINSSTAYGLMADVADKEISLTKCEITGQSKTNNAYAISSVANVTADGCILTASALGTDDAYGLFAKGGTNLLLNSEGTITAHGIKAYGVNHTGGSVTIDGGETYTVTVDQLANTANSELYGIKNAADVTTIVKDATFEVTTSSSLSKNVFGAYIEGTLQSANSKYTISANSDVYGLYGLDKSSLILSDNTVAVTVVSGTKGYGIFAKKNFTINGDAVRATGLTTDVYALYFVASSSAGTVLDGKFYAKGNGTTSYGSINGNATKANVKLKGGIYSHLFNVDTYKDTGYDVYHLDDSHPDFATGHRFVVATENPTPYVCYIKGGNKYETLKDAMQYAKDNSGSNFTIVMTQDYTLPSGDYELPSNATLLVPYDADVTDIQGGEPALRIVPGIRTENIRLTLASGAHLNVDGKIEVASEMYCTHSYTSYINSPYARIQMDTLSLIQLNNGAYLYAWGYITGKGEIKVKNNAQVHEMFQIGDMKGLGELAQNYVPYGNPNSYKFFPLNRYYIQNIEVPTTYYYNARLVTAMSDYDGKHYSDLNIKLIGLQSDGALFAVTSTNENAWVRKSYDAAKDHQVWDVNSSVQLGSLALDLGTFDMGIMSVPIKFNSSQYILPLTSNMKVHVLDGTFSITQDAQLLPGVEVEVDKTATLQINSGVKVYVFDKDQWPWTSQYTVEFSPGWKNGKKPSRTVSDAALNIHGNIDVNEALYTSNKGDETSKTDGANIYSKNEDAGTIMLGKNAPSATTITLMTSASATKTVNMEPAKLKNGTGASKEYTQTSGTASGHAFAYINNEWQETYTNGCFEVIGSTVYAKPSGYVALQKSQNVGGKLKGVEEADHTYLAEGNKILILMDECQWWEVKATDDPAVFECKKEGYEGYYYYNTSTSKWALKTVNVDFYANETGNTKLKTITTNWKGIPDQSVIATNPSKATTDEFTYDFYGWKSSVTGATFQWTATLEEAEANMSYRPVFTEKKRNYSITLIDANNGNVVVETPYGEKPVYEPKKDATAQYTYTFREWSPALQNVTGTATYTALWDQTLNKYNITWKDGENTLEVDENQDYGTATAYNGTLPTKAADNEFAYTFSEWKSSLNGNSYNNGSTPTVAGETTYEAQYTTTPRYKVTFNNYDAELTSAYYTQGETPAYDGVPARKRDDNGYYKFIGWKNSAGTDYAANATLPAVSKKETYTAQYEYVTDLFTITLKNIDGNDGTWSGKFGEGSTPFYAPDPENPDVPGTPAKEGNEQYEYVFDGWALTKGGAKLNPVPAVTEDATYWARFNQTARTYNITYNLNGGSNTYGGYTPATSYTYGVGATLPPAANMHRDGYSFDGWFANSGLTGSAVTSVSSSETGNKEFWAKWTENLQTVNVAYKCGDNDIQAGTSVANVGVATTKNVTAPAITGYTFQNWTLPTGVTTSSALTSSTITIQATAADKTITANYKLIDYTITHGAAAHGNYTIKVGSAAPVNGEAKANVNQIITLETMHIDEGYRLGAWNVTAGGNPVEVTNNQFTMPAANVTINPTFVVNTSTLTIGVNNVEYGSVSPSVVANVPFESSVTVNNNAFTVNGTTVTANPSAQTAQYTYTFSGWQNLPETVTGDVDNIQAVFTRSDRKYRVTWDVATNGGTCATEYTDFSYNAAIGTLPVASKAGHSFNGWFTSATGGTQITDATKVTTDITYHAQFMVNEYTITWVDGNGATLKTEQVAYGATPAYTGETPTKTATAQYTYTFNNTWSPAIVSVTGAATYTAQFKSYNQDLVVDEPDEKIDEDVTITSTTVTTTGDLEVTEGNTLTTTDLILESSLVEDGESSGEIRGAGDVTPTGNVYFDLTLNTWARHWRAFGVPWKIASLKTTKLVEIRTKNGTPCHNELELGRDYDIVYYNGEKRAQQGPGRHCWDYVEDGDGTLDPGKAYLIGFIRPTGTVRFTKEADAPIHRPDEILEVQYYEGNGVETDAGWNAIANPKTYHAAMDAGVSFYHVHNGDTMRSDGFTTKQMSEVKFVVGTAVFVQATPAKSEVDITRQHHSPSALAPHRVAAHEDAPQYHAIHIMANNKSADRIYIKADEDKETDTYTNGIDVAKMGISTVRAQIWVERYNTQLAVNTMAPVNNTVSYPLGISVPQAGEYEIQLSDESSDMIYLTYDNRIIWNLSYSPYVANLEKGANTHYGIRMVMSKTPAITTDVEEVQDGTQQTVQKIIIEDKVYILRGEKLYTITGQLVQ